MATLYSTVLACFLLAAVTSAEPVNYTNILRGISEACDDLNNSSNDQLTNQYYGSLSNEEKDIFDRFSDVKSFACAMKNQKLFTLQDLKVLADSFIDCSNLITLNSTIVKFSYEWVYSANVCVFERLKSVKSDNSMDVEGLKKYMTAYIVWTKPVTDGKKVYEMLDICGNKKGSSAKDTIVKFLDCILQNRQTS